MPSFATDSVTETNVTLRPRRSDEKSEGWNWALAGWDRRVAAPVSVTESGLPEPLGRFRTERRRALGQLVHTHIGVEPPILAFLVDFALADEEARIQPAVLLRFCGQLHPCENRPPFTG